MKYIPLFSPPLHEYAPAPEVGGQVSAEDTLVVDFLGYLENTQVVSGRQLWHGALYSQ